MDRAFNNLGVKIKNGQVYTVGWPGSPLGPLAGAVISINPEGRARRVGGSVAATVALAPALGPLPLLGMLSKKDRVTVYIQFTNGRLHQKTIKGNFAVRSAHGEAMQFQSMAQRAPVSERGQRQDAALSAAEAESDRQAWLDLERKYADHDEAPDS